MSRIPRWTLAPVTGLAVATLALITLGACSSQRQKAISIKGSDTMVLLGQRWAETYMAKNPGAVIQVTGGGSGTGIAALINGTTDICQSSRPIKDDEREQLTRVAGGPPHETIVARDGLAVYLHESNPVQSLTVAQLKDIYTGAVTSWRQVGGPDASFVVYGRENSSGTYEYFKEHVLEKQDFASSVQTLPGTSAVVNAVAHDPNGIGYGGAAYAKGVRVCAVKRDADSPAILPTEATVLDGSYPIARPLQFYTRQAPAGAIKAFVDYVVSPEGQALVTEVGYYPSGQTPVQPSGKP